MRTTWLWTAGVLLALAGGSYLLYESLQSPPLPAQLIYANGRVEATEVRIATEVAGQVVESALVEGQAVAAGELLVRLDPTDMQLQIARTRAQVAALGQEKAQIGNELAVARHHLTTAEAEVSRVRKLREQGSVSPRQMEQADNLFQEAKGQVAALEATLRATDARIDAAERELDLLGNRLQKTTVRAPRDGTIAIKGVERGEFVQPGQSVAILVDLSDARVKAFVAEREIGKIKLGAPARVRVDAYPEHLFEARVARIDQSAQFTPRDIHMPEERVRLVFGVTLGVDNPEGILKPGMPADAWILWDPDAGWPDPLFVPQ
ncbi:HlyD family secretion protein [Gilvimarinus sp. F26214L]|uniref:HlyD family secretion protein n=1 Tax=Gilvimarinus sp. DZF01 TaxID=3461371 RepID=UPI0040458856